MQCQSLRPRALSLWEAVACPAASSPIGIPHRKTVTVHCTRRQTSNKVHLNISKQLLQDKTRNQPLRRVVDNFRSVKEAAIRSGLSTKDRKKIVAETYVSPISENDRRVEQELNDTAIRPIEMLQRCIQTGLASPHVLHVCFDAQFSDQRRYPRRKRSQMHELQRGEQLARAALLYMLQDPAKWTTILHKNTSFVDNLCYFAVIEGLQDFMIRFLKVTPKPDNPYWRAKVVTALVMAEDLLDLHHCADDTLKFFFNVAEMQAAARNEYNIQRQQSEAAGAPSLVKYDVLHYAATKLRVILPRGGEPLGRYRTDPVLYDRFLQFYLHDMPRKDEITRQESEWTVCELQLFHPGGLNESPALKLLQKYAKEGQYAFMPDPAKHGAPITQTIANFVRRTADVAEANSNMAAARWVFNTFEEDYLKAKPWSLDRVESALSDLGPSATHVQRRLYSAIMRSDGDTRTLLSARAGKAATVQVASDPMAHANKFQNMLCPAAKQAKQPESRKCGFGL